MFHSLWRTVLFVVSPSKVQILGGFPSYLNERANYSYPVAKILRSFGQDLKGLFKKRLWLTECLNQCNQCQCWLGDSGRSPKQCFSASDLAQIIIAFSSFSLLYENSLGWWNKKHGGLCARTMSSVLLRIEEEKDKLLQHTVEEKSVSGYGHELVHLSC